MSFRSYTGEPLYHVKHPTSKGRKLGPMCDTALPPCIAAANTEYERKRLIDLAALSRRYCKAAIFSGEPIFPLTAARGLLWLYFEELHTGRKTQPHHRHVLTLDEAALIPPFCYYRGRFDVGEAKVRGINSPETARELFREFTGGLLDDIDWTDTYVTGSCIDYCCAKRSAELRKATFSESDIDLFVDGNLTDRAEAIYNAVHQRDSSAIFVAIKLANSANVKYAISTATRKIEVYNSPFGNVVGYHVPCVRGWCQNGIFRLTVSAALTFQTSIIPEYRWVKGNDYVLRVIEKNISRGYVVRMSTREMEIYRQFDSQVNKTPIEYIHRDRYPNKLFHYNRVRPLDASNIVTNSVCVQTIYLNLPSERRLFAYTVAKFHAKRDLIFNRWPLLTIDGRPITIADGYDERRRRRYAYLRLRKFELKAADTLDGKSYSFQSIYVDRKRGPQNGFTVLFCVDHLFRSRMVPQQQL